LKPQWYYLINNSVWTWNHKKIIKLWKNYLYVNLEPQYDYQIIKLLFLCQLGPHGHFVIHLCQLGTRIGLLNYAIKNSMWTWNHKWFSFFLIFMNLCNLEPQCYYPINNYIWTWNYNKIIKLRNNYLYVNLGPHGHFIMNLSQLGNTIGLSKYEKIIISGLGTTIRLSN
jgi:hypothetical protein